MSETNYEEKVLSLLLNDANLIKEVRIALSPEYFLSGQLRTFFECVLEYYESSDGAVPTTDILLSLVEKRNPQSVELYKPLLERVLEASGPEDQAHIAFYCAEIENSWKSNQVQAKMLSAIEILKDRKDVDRAMEVLQNEMPLGKNEFVQGDILKDLMAHVGTIEYRSKHPEIYGGIPMGFPSLDGATYGHVRGELAIIVGGTGVGKSLVLGQVAINVSKRGKKTLLVTIENNKHSYMNRIYSNISGVDAWKFKANQLDKHDQERWIASMGRLPDPFDLKIVEFPLGCSARDVWDFMRTLEYEVEYLCIDQISNMNPNNIREHRPMTHLWYNQISLDLKRLAGYAYKNKGVPLLTAMQAGGGVVGVKELTVDQIAGAKAVLTHASMGLYITKDEDNLYSMGASKARDAFVKVFPVFPDFRCWRVAETQFDVGTTSSTSPPVTSPMSSSSTPYPEARMQTVPKKQDRSAETQATENEAF